MLEGAMERPIGARWSMAAIADAVGGVGHFGKEAWTVRWAAVAALVQHRAHRLDALTL